MAAKLGTRKVRPEFIANAIDLDVLPELTEDDLERLRLPLGDRERSIRAIKTTATNLRVYQSRAKSGRRRANSLLQQVAGERRHLTVMNCDLVGSTALSAGSIQRT